MEKKYKKQFKVTGTRQVNEGDDGTDENRAYYSGLISNGELDSHYSRMSESTLRNFSEGSKRGISVLDSHKHSTSGLGITTDGRYDEEENAVYADFYIVRDVDLDGQSYRNTDGFIKMLDDGALRDLSVGFYGGTEICDICDVPIWYSRDCFHLPGQDVIIVDEETDEKTVVTVTTRIEDAMISELSLVYDGSNEDTQITDKANKLAEKGLINSKQKRFMEQKFNVRFKQNLKFPEPENQDEIDKIKNKNKDSDKDKVRNNEGDNPMAKTVEELQQEVEDLDKQLTEVRANADTWKEKGERAAALEVANDDLESKNEKLEKRQSDDADTIERLTEQKRELKEEVDKMKPMAEEGERYRTEEEEKAYEEFVRMRGDDLNEEEKDSDRAKNTLSNLATIKDVRDMAKTWGEAADVKYPEGRKTSDTGTTDPDDEPKDEPKDSDNDSGVDVLPGADSY